VKLVHEWEQNGNAGTWIIGSRFTPDDCPIFVAEKRDAYVLGWSGYMKDEDGYYVVHPNATKAVGPYPDLETALVVADTMHALREYPR
jgi:hypothetical protein